MKRHIAWLVGGMGLALFAAAVLGGPTLGQEAKPQSFQVGLVDLKVVFDKLPNFKEQLDELRREVEGREKEFKVKTTEFAAKVAEHKKLPPAQQQEGREALEQEQKQIRAWFDEQKALFLKKEAAIYEAQYRIVTDEIARQAQKKGIALVLRTNETAAGDEGNPEERKPEQVLRMLNKPVLYQREELDLTNAVIAALTNQ